MSPRFPIDTPPWKKAAPRGKRSTPLTPEQKSAARTRAEAAGRRYPNLIDNMWAARHVARGPAPGDAVGEEE